MKTYVILHRSGWRSPQDLQQAAEADLPLDEVIPVADTVLVRPDPEPAAA